MPNTFFRFKKFTVHHDRCAMKVTTDACLFGAWCAAEMENEGFENALDIGTGTGLLSLMIAQKTRGAITAIDIDNDAVVQAKENVSASPWSEKIEVVCADATKFMPRQRFDVIFSNPPFYENEIESPDNKRKIAHHSEGLKLQDLVTSIKINLEEVGMFYLLLPYKRVKYIEDILSKAGLFVHKQVVVSPTTSHQPSRLMIKGGQHPKAVLVSDLSIHSSAKKYTTEFEALLKDYYLFL